MSVARMIVFISPKMVAIIHNKQQNIVRNKGKKQTNETYPNLN